VSEEIEKVARRLRERYPGAGTVLDSLVRNAKAVEDHAKICNYYMLLEDYGNYKASRRSVLEINMYADDILELMIADRNFSSHIMEMLKRCGCRS